MDRLHWIPVGPLPAAVYWRRRAGVLLGALLVVLLLLQLTGGEQDAALEQAGPAPSAAPSASSSASPSATGSGGAVPACAPTALRVQADTAPADVPAGAGAAVRVAVTNTSSVPCSVRLGDGAVELLVVSGRDRIWSSDDCDEAGAGADDGRTDLAPGERRLLEVAWDGRRSRPGCAEQGEVARAGTYRVLARVGLVEVEGRAFRVL